MPAPVKSDQAPWRRKHDDPNLPPAVPVPKSRYYPQTLNDLTQAFQPVYAGGPFDAFLSRILNYDDQEEEAARSLHTNDGHERGCRQRDED